MVIINCLMKSVITATIFAIASANSYAYNNEYAYTEAYNNDYAYSADYSYA